MKLYTNQIAGLTRVKLKTFLVSIIFAVLSPNAFAEIDFTGMYAGAQFGTSKDEFTPDSGSSESASKGHVKAKIGKYLNQNLAAEGQFGLTTNTGGSQGILTYGGYLRYSWDFGQYRVYGLGGLGGIFAYEDGVDDVSETSFSYGVGLEIFGSKDLTITFEYLSLLDTSVDGGDYTFGTVGLGFTYYFTEDKSYFNKNRNKIRSIRY